MLKLLIVRNIALAASVEMEFGPGLTLLTGETGAGKSLLVDALGVALGSKADPDLVRTGEASATVEALFESADAAQLIAQRGLPLDGNEIVVRRELRAAGRGKATVNGALAPTSLLREIAPFLAVIHGQHESQDVLDPETHVDILDRWAGLSDEAAAVAEAFRALRAAEGALAALRESAHETARRREMLEFQLGEIDGAAISAGEGDALRAERAVQANAEKLATLCNDAYAALYEAEQAALGRLALVFRKVEELRAIDPRFAPHLEAWPGARASLEDLAFFLRDYRAGLTADPTRLDAIESRLALLDRLKKKYGATENDVLAFAARCRAQLADLVDPDQARRRLESDRDQHFKNYLSLAEALSNRRRDAAAELEKLVKRELDQLAMEKTVFRVHFDALPFDAEQRESDRLTPRGIERVSFLLSPNPGEELRPLANIASGGELSRILLALQTVDRVGRAGVTYVFDEVDSGIGGRVAEVVGRKLRAVAEHHQVLCVTHLPQIASLAETHYAVRKRVDKGRTVSEVSALDEGQRVEEIARLLGGKTITELTRRHAREMLQMARKDGRP